jgi:PAS domain S-box-containing protein
MPITELLRKSDFFTEPMALVSVDGTIDASNQPFAEQLGVAPEALTGRRLDALAAASAAAIQEFVQACARSDKALQCSLVLHRRSDTIPVQARGVAYRADATASQVLLRLVAQNRSSNIDSGEPLLAEHWREVEASLRRQSQILEVTLASIGEAVIVTDREGRVTFLNTVAESLTGWPLEDAKGQTLKDVFRIINERTRQIAEDPVSKVLKTGQTIGLANHTVLIGRGGREMPIDDSAAPIRAPNGELFGVVLVFRDITDRRRAEHAQAWLAAIVESSGDAIISKTLDGVITSWNPGAARLFGYTPEEIIGKSITTIIPSELKEEEDEILARLRRGESIDHFETQRIAKNGKCIDISLTVSPIRDEAGEIVGASKIARDITERKRQEQMLRDAGRRKDVFLATLAHELRNPLAPLRNAATILCRTKHESPALTAACDIVDRQVRQMARLLDDLLDISRISAGRLELREEFVDVAELVGKIAASLQPTFSAAHQQLDIAISAEPLYVYADRIRLTQAFSNLMHNAHKYTPVGGRITVGARREGRDVVVSVRDTGIGIASSKLDLVFELFAQVAEPSERPREGLGIGLSVAKRLIEVHGGRIEAHSEGLGRGSEFIARLPLRDVPTIMRAEAATIVTTQVARRILIAEDNADAATSLSMLLEGMGHHTRIVHDGLAALKAAEEMRPDVAIIDIGMPGLDGYNVARKIAAQSWSAQTLLVALTGWGQEADRQRAREAGFHHHLVKPVEPEVLRELVSHRVVAASSTDSGDRAD